MFLRTLGLFLLLVLSSCAEPPYNNLDNAQLKTLVAQGVPIFDIRRKDEWQQTGVVEGSQLLTFVDGSGRVVPDFLQRFTSLVGKDDPVILICHTGNRSAVLASHLMEQLGYTHVYNVRDGITRWMGEGHDVKRVRF